MSNSSEYQLLIEKRFAALKSDKKHELFFSKVPNLESLSFEDKEFLVDSFRWAEPIGLAPARWLYELIPIVDRAVAGVAVLPELNMFFIRLDGILAELRPYYEATKQHHKFFGKDGKTFKKSNEEIINQLKKLAASFTETERLYIKFSRNQNAHIFIHEYKIRQNADGGFARTVRHSDQPLISRMDEIATYLRSFKGDETAIVVTLGSKAQPILRKLKELLKARDDLNFAII